MKRLMDSSEEQNWFVTYDDAYSRAKQFESAGFRIEVYKHPAGLYSYNVRTRGLMHASGNDYNVLAYRIVYESAETIKLVGKLGVYFGIMIIFVALLLNYIYTTNGTNLIHMGANQYQVLSYIVWGLQLVGASAVLCLVGFYCSLWKGVPHEILYKTEVKKNG